MRRELQRRIVEKIDCDDCEGHSASEEDKLIGPWPAGQSLQFQSLPSYYDSPFRQVKTMVKGANRSNIFLLRELLSHFVQNDSEEDW